MSIPKGLALRPEFRTQHDEGKETPRSGASSPPKAPGGDSQQRDPGKPPGQSTQGCYDMLPMIVLMVVVFYFFLIRPQQKQEKALKALRAALKKGDRVVTSGGMHAVVHKVENNAVSLRPTADGPIMVFDSTAIARVVTDEATAQDAADQKKLEGGK